MNEAGARTTQVNVRYPDAVVDAADLLKTVRIFKSRSEFFIWCARDACFRFGILEFNPNKELPKHMANEQEEIYDELTEKMKEMGELVKRGKENNVDK